MKVHHPLLKSGRWFVLSLTEQLGNVGSEVSRAVKFKDKDELLFQNSFNRALELLDLTLADRRWRTGLKELARARELLCAAALGSSEYNTSLEEMDEYFYRFALAARLKR